ncbi:MAG: uncharacterized protein QOH16_311 [Gaiellaceae bacterium]|jgi:uncharacterized membrane protein YfcA|nr:uncharacterized protein [Gaiellaceae bacterium]
MNGVALYAALVAFGVLVGAVAGLLGIGGGLLMVPFLTIVAGATQHQAEATSLLVILPTAIVATVTLRRKGIGDAGLALRFGTVGAVGGIAGALVALALPAHVLRLIFALFLAVMSVRMLRDGLTTKPEEEASNA